MTLATKLVSLRKQKGLSQMELAEKLNVSRQAISGWEVGAAVPSTDNLKMLGALYDVSVDYLLNDINDDVESQRVETIAQADSFTRKGHKKKALLVIAVALIVVAMISMIAILGQNRDIPTPIGDMDIVEEDNYSTDVFLIE